MVDSLGGHTAAQNTLGSEGLRDGDALSSTTLSNLLQGLRGNGIVRLQDTAYGSTRNAVNTQPGAVTRASTHTLTVQGGYAVLDGVLYEFAGGPGGTATVTIGTHGDGTALAASGEQSMYSVYIASQGGQAKIHVDGGSPVQTSTGLYPQLPTQFLVDYDTGGSILNDQVVVLATLRCSYNSGGGSHKVDVQEVNDKRIFTRANPIYMTPLSSGTIVTDGSELSQISRGAAEGINTAAQLNALFSGNEAGVLGNNANGTTKIDVGALWMSTGRSGSSLGYGPGDGLDRSSSRMKDDLFFAGQNNDETGVITKRLFTEGVSAPTGTLSTASYTITSHGDKWFIFAPANSATITLNPEKSGSTYLFPEGHVVEVCNNASANGGNIVFDSTGLNTTLLPDQRATFIFEGSTWLRCDYQAAISTMAFVTLTDTPSSLGSAGQYLKVNSGGNALEFVSSPTLTTEQVQDIIGDMVSGNTETNITVTYQDSDGTIDFVVPEQRTDAQVKDLAGAMFTGNTETWVTATYQTSDDTVDLVVPVHDEDNMASNSATHLATQQSIKAYVDTSISGVIASAPGALDTLNELAAAINDDASFHTTMTTALSNRVRVDTSSQGLTSTQKSNARTNMGLGTMSTLSAIDISANTNLAVSAPLILTGDTLSIDDIPFSALHANAVQISSESFADNDTTLMTSASIQDKILSYGYSTTTGTVTSVATGTGLTGGSITGSGTISLSHLGLESLSDPGADRIMFWDDSAGVLKFLTAGSNLAFSGTTLNATNTNQLTTFTVRDDDDDAKTVAHGKFIKFVSATGTAGTNWSGSGTTGDPWVMTITNPDTQLSQAQVRDFAGGMFTGNTETFITATYQTGDDTVDLVVPVLDEDDMASNSASHLATQQSIKSYVDTEVSDLIASAPGALDTLNELAAAINDDASFHTTMTNALAARLRVDTASQGLTGTQKSNARTNLGLGSMATLSSIDISDNTNLAAGTGIDLSGDTISADVSDFMANGSDNRVVTATGADAMNAEANLTWDGTSFGIGTSSPLSKVHIEKTAHDFDSSPVDGDFHLFLKATESSTAGDAVSIGFAQSSDGSTVGSKISHLVENSFSRGGLVFSTNNTASAGDTTAERMRITGAGNVGIGVTDPAEKLEVAGSILIDYALAHKGDTNNQIQFDTDIQYFKTAGATRMSIIADGNVGIGTTSPTTKLDVNDNVTIRRTGEIDTSLFFRSEDGSGGTTDYSAFAIKSGWESGESSWTQSYMKFNHVTGADTYATTMTLKGGNVGIGDTTPSYKLDVTGDINLTGDLRQNGNVITTYNLYDNEITLTAGTGLSGGGAFTLNQNSDETLTFNVSGLTVSELAANSLQTSGESFADNDTSLMTSAAIQDKIEAYGYSTTSGDITNVAAGVGLSGGGGSGSVTLTLDMSELPDMTQAVTSNQDELIILDNGADKRKLISEIPLSAFNNDSGFTAGVSAVTNGANNRIATFTSGTALNAEEYLQFDGTLFTQTNATGSGTSAGDSVEFRRHKMSGGTGNQIYELNYQVRNTASNTDWVGASTRWGYSIDNASPTVGYVGATSGLRNWQEVDHNAAKHHFGHADDTIMTIDGSTDRVGIGTTSPDVLLDIEGSGKLLQLNSGNNSGTYMGIANTRGMVGYSSGGLFLQGGYDKHVIFGVNNGTFGSGEVARFDKATGYLGIGETAPDSHLEITEDTDGEVAVHIHNSYSGGATTALATLRLTNDMGTDSNFEIKHDAWGGTKFYGNTTHSFTIANGGMFFSEHGSLAMKEKAAAAADTAAYGQLWVKTATPNELYFTTDAGDDIQLTSGTSAAGGGSGAVSAVANGSNNRIATFSSADALNGEANLTYDGSTLTADNGGTSAVRIQGSNNYSITHVAESTGPKIHMGDMDTAQDNWMTIGAFNGINNWDTTTRDWHLYGTNTTAGLYFDESAGSVGIGTTSPSTPLAANAKGLVIAGTGGRIDAAQDGTERIPTLILYDTVSDYGSGTATVGEVRGSIEFYQSETTNNYPAEAGSIKLINEGTYNDRHGLAFYTNTNATDATEKMRIDEAGKVGIGTASPDSTLHLTSGSGYLKFETSGSVGSIKSDFNLDLYADDTDGNSSGYQNIRFFPAGTEAMRIAHDGKVGIGTTSPQAPLHVVGNVMIANTDSDNTVKDSRILGRTYTNNDYNLIYGYADSNTNRLYLGGGTGTGEPATDIRFFTAALNADTDASGTEAMRITSAGLVGIGTASPGEKLHVAGGNVNLDAGYHYVFRDRSDLGMKELNYSVAIMAPEEVYIQLDSNNNNNDDTFFAVNKNGQAVGGGTELFRVQENGRVGIGTSSPDDALHVRAASDHPLILQNTNNAQYVGIKFSDHATGNAYSQTGEILFNHADSLSDGAGASFHFTSTESLNVIMPRLSIKHTLPSNDATTLSGAEVFKVDSIDDQSTSGGPGFQIRLESTNDHNAANYQRVFMGDGGGMKVKNKFGNWGFSEWWLAGNADGWKPIMSLGSGGSSSAGEAQDGILTLYSTTSAWADNTWSPSNNTSKVVLDAGGDSYFTGGDVGIGTSSPTFPLDVNGWIAAASGIVHTGDTNNTIQFETDIQKFNTAGTTRMTIAADGDIDVSGGMQSTSTSKGWNLWHSVQFAKLDYGTTAGSGAALQTLGHDDNEAGVANYSLEEDITIRAVVFRTNGVVLSGTVAQQWRIFANGSSSVGTLTNISLDAGDFTRQDSENANATAHYYTVTGLNASYNKGDTLSIKRQTGAVDMGDVYAKIYYSIDN